MNLVNVCVSNSKVFSGFDVIAIRFGLMTADRTCSIGDLYYGVRAKFDFEKPRSMKSKLDELSLFQKSNPESLEMNTEQFEQTKANYKFLKNVKHKSNVQLKQFIAIEKFIDQYYTNYRKHYNNSFAQAGMSQLEPFLGNQFDIYATDINAPEEAGKQNYHVMSEMLLDRFDINTTYDLYLVTGHFSMYLKENNTVISKMGDVWNKDSEVITAQNILLFPHLVQLSTNEIELVRDHLMSTNQLFRTNMQNWNIDLFSTPFAEKNFDKMSKTFFADIEPTTKLLQKEIDVNERLILAKSRLNYLELRINLYVTTIEFYWKYLLSINAIEQQTLDVMYKFPDYETLKNNCCIILEASSCNVGEEPTMVLNGELPAEEPTPLVKRKTLDI